MAKYRGVYQNGKYWMAVICIQGTRKYLGSFDNPEDACRVYLTAKEKFRGKEGKSGPKKRSPEFYIGRMEEELGI